MSHCRFHVWHKRGLIVLSSLIAIGLLGVYIGTSAKIGLAVRRSAGNAMQRYEGGAVEALIQEVEDSGRPLAQRNRAVWALGQLGDPRALHVLRRFSTGEPCDHETALCQHEVEKAISLLKGDLNVTAFVWR